MEEGMRVKYKLVACPFCGRSGADAAIYPDGKCFRVWCGGCEAQGPLSIMTDSDPELAVKDAVRRWNREPEVRPPMSDAVRKDREIHLVNMAFRIGSPPYGGPRHK